MNWLIGLAIVASVCVAAYQILRSVAEWNDNNRQPVTEVAASLAAKREEAEKELAPSDDNHFPQPLAPQHFATFTLENGETLEFLIQRSEFDQLNTGESGTLSYQGTRYLGFRK